MPKNVYMTIFTKHWLHQLRCIPHPISNPISSQRMECHYEWYDATHDYYAYLHAYD